MSGEDEIRQIRDLAVFLEGMRMPRCELRCHPGVVDALRAASPPPLFRPDSSPLRIDIFTDEEMSPGRWQLLKDGETAAEGQLEMRADQD